MAMAWVWTGMVAVSVVYGWFNGTIAAVGTPPWREPARRWSCA